MSPENQEWWEQEINFPTLQHFPILYSIHIFNRLDAMCTREYHLLVTQSASPNAALSWKPPQCHTWRWCLMRYLAILWPSQLRHKINNHKELICCCREKKKQKFLPRYGRWKVLWTSNIILKLSGYPCLPAPCLCDFSKALLLPISGLFSPFIPMNIFSQVTQIWSSCFPPRPSLSGFLKFGNT